MIQSPYELLWSLKQEGTVEEYHERFELYAGPLRGAEPEYLKRDFSEWLKGCSEGRTQTSSSSLPELMDFAQSIDEKNTLLTKGNTPGSKGGGSSRNYTSSRIVVTLDLGNKGSQFKSPEGSSSMDTNSVRSTGSYRGRPFKRLSDAELQDKANRGWCYQCDGRFVPGHVCANKQSKG